MFKDLAGGPSGATIIAGISIVVGGTCTSIPLCFVSTNLLVHFCYSKIRNCFFVQAEFFDLLFHFVGFLVC
jgi:hypothetical protein